MQHSGTVWGLCVCVHEQPYAYMFKFVELREDAGERKTLSKIQMLYGLQSFSHVIELHSPKM